MNNSEMEKTPCNLSVTNVGSGVVPNINAILHFIDANGRNNVNRIIWEDLLGKEIFTIDILGKRAMPVNYDGQEIVAGIERGEIQVLQQDPYAYLTMPQLEINENSRRYCDKAWATIQPLIENHFVDLLTKETRGKIISQRSKETRVSRVTIYNYLQKYWQRGLIINALLPDFRNCGGRGKRKKLGSKKTGKPRIYVRQEQIMQGINITEGTKSILLRGLKKYYGRGIGQYTSFVKAYKRVLEEYFNIGYRLKGKEFVPVMPLAETLPTLRQARYWYKESIGIKKKTITLVGEKTYNLRFRPIPGNSTQFASTGPGAVYQIDSTIGDIYLVSSMDRSRIVGRPTIYVIRDMFSRLIVGFHATLENPSRMGAMCAIENALTDKVKYCAQYGIEIQQEQWPCCHIPVSILADRGEMKGISLDDLPNLLGVSISNARPYAAEWKGIVERTFRQINDDQLHRLPGGIRKPHERGDPDYRLAAVLDINQLRTLLIKTILQLNNSTHIDKYPLTREMIADHVLPIPIELWNWGVANKKGMLREKPPDIVRLNLLPRDDSARITPKGIEFRHLLYNSELALREGWLIDARVHGKRKITVAYDPRSVNQVFLFLDNGKKYEVCKLSESVSAFLDHDWEEVKDQKKANRIAREADRTRILQSEAEYQASVDEIIEKAQEQTRSAKKKQSKRAKIGKIRANRHEERQHERKQHAWTNGEKIGTIPAILRKSISKSQSGEEEYLGPPSYAALIKRQMAEEETNDRE